MPSLDFKGKQFVYTHHVVVPFRQLVAEPQKSLLAREEGPTLVGNLIIHGDNLHGLKALLPLHAGKVKCIYIDPPYNTGSERWCYNDNVRSPLMQEWLKKSANPVEKDDLERHDKWLCMMWPRLQLLHELLAYGGAIFVSIDDNELHSLLAIMFEIFGDNHVATIPVVNNMKGRNDKANIARCHEYLVVFSKGKFISRGLPLTEKQKKEFRYVLPDGRRYALRDLRRRGGADRREDRPAMHFPVYYDEASETFSLTRVTSDAVEIFPIKKDGSAGRWRWGEGKVRENLHRLEPRRPSRNESWGVNYRVLLEEDDPSDTDEADDVFGEDDYDDAQETYHITRTSKSKSFWWGPELSSDTAGKALKALFPDRSNPFDYPKAVEFVKRVVHMAAGPDDLILDSFAGSGTTAEAVLAVNADDGGRRRFILVESEAYADDLTAERVRRVIQRDAGAASLSPAISGATFSFFALGDEIDIGSLLTGDKLPDFESLARYVFYTATGRTLDGVPKPRADYRIGETATHSVHLLYRPDRDFMRSADSALTSKVVDAIDAAKPDGKKALVFASAKFMGQKELTARGIEFCQLPYAIHRVLGN